MRDFAHRRLSAAEIRIGRRVFANEIDWPRVRLAQVPRLGFGAMVPIGSTILFSNWRAAWNFADAGVSEQGWFVHELAHVWQARQGVILAFRKLSAIGLAAYRYDARPGRPFGAYNIEQQAEIARHVFLARCGVCAADAPSQVVLEALWPIRAEASE